MKKIYFSLIAMLFVVATATAQTIVPVAPGTGTIQAAIDGVALEDRSNTVFQLQRGGEYIQEGTIGNDDFDLTIVAEDGSGPRPILRIMDGEEDDPFQSRNVLTLKGLYIDGTTNDGLDKKRIITVKDPTEAVILEDCHLDDCSLAAIKIQSDSTEIRLTDCIVSNIADGISVGGAGSVFQDQSAMGGVIIANNTSFYNIFGSVLLDVNAPESFKSQVEFDHCTMVNVGGTGLELNSTINAVITNNQFINVGFAGSGNSQDIAYAVQISDLLPPLVDAGLSQAVTFTHNNFFIEQALLDALPDTVNPVEGYNELMKGYADEGTFLNEEIAFTTPLPSVVGLLDMYTNPEFEGDFDRSAVPDFGYNDKHASYTGESEGGIIGDLSWDYPSTVSVKNIEMNDIDLTCYPNPVNGHAIISFESENAAFVSIDVIDLTGSVVKSVYRGNVNFGVNSFDLETNDMVGGLYFTRLIMNGAPAVQKIVVK